MVLTFLLLIVFPAAMAFAASSDFVTMTISNRLQLVLIVSFAVAAVLTHMDLTTLGLHVATGAFMLVATFFCFSMGWIGGGDAKLVAVTALWFGPTPALADYLLVSTVIGGALTLALLYARSQPVPSFLAREGWAMRLLDAKAGIPYGIALAAGALLAYPQTHWMSVALG